MSGRLFAVSTDDTNFCGPWSSNNIHLPGDDINALRSLFAEHYPKHRIVEMIGQALAIITAPIAIIVETIISDISEMKESTARDLLKMVLTAAIIKLPIIDTALKNDEGYRASYLWDSGIKRFVLHIVFPNTYHLASEIYSALKNIKLSAPLNHSSYISCFMQDTICGCTRCIPLYLGPQFMTLQETNEGYLITNFQPQIGVRANSEVRTTSLVVAPAPLLSGGAGGVSGRLFGNMPYWFAPVEKTVEFFIRMIKTKTHEYDNICCDVAYTECGTLSESMVERIVGKPRIGMKEKSVRFLHWVAKRACPEEYNQWILEQCAVAADYFSNKPVTDEIFHRLNVMKLEGKYISVVHGRDANAQPSLYYFKNIWKIDRGMSRLGEDISRLLTVFIGDELKDYMQKNSQGELYNALLNESMRLSYMSSMRNQGIKAAARMFAEEVNFDEDPNLLGCNNKVIELGEHGAIARPGRPEDLISKTTHLHYRKCDDSDPECIEIRTMFNKLLPDRELRDWFMLLLYSMLSGNNPERCFYLMFGSAKNGKSGILNFLENIFGDYFGRFSGKAFNERSDPSSTSPELASMHGMRVMAGSELKAGVQMEADIIKALTGGDGVQACAKYQDPKVLRMMAKIIIATNHFPIFLHADKALRDRTVLIPLESLFSNYNVPKTEEEQYRKGHFQAIENFLPTLQRLAPAMLSMMVEGFASYKTIGLSNKPKKVVNLTEGYWHEVGVQTRFMSDCIEFIKEGEQIMTPIGEGDSVLPLPPTEPEGRPQLLCRAAYDRFVVWAASRGLDVSKYPRSTFKSLMDCEMLSLKEFNIVATTDAWIGCRLKKSMS